MRYASRASLDNAILTVDVRPCLEVRVDHRPSLDEYTFRLRREEGVGHQVQYITT